MLLERKEHSWIQVVLFFSHEAEMQGTYELMHNGNWTERRAILSEIIRVLSKSNKLAAWDWFEIASTASATCGLWKNLQVLVYSKLHEKNHAITC